MLHGSSCGSWGYAQSGYNATYPNTTPYDFAQQSNCSGSQIYSNFPTSSLYQATLGTSYKYETEPDSTNGVISGVEINNTFYSLEDTGANHDWSGLNIGEFYGEVGHDENDMPGTASAPANFTQMEFEYSGSWSSSYLFSSADDEQPGSWGLSSLSSQPSFSIWTK